MGKVTIIYENGETIPAPCSTLPLEKLQQMVGGLIQPLPYFRRYEGEKCVAYCDEEGKLKGNKVNSVASNLWYDELARNGFKPPYSDCVVGALVIVQGPDLLGKL